MQKWEYCVVIGIRQAGTDLWPYSPSIWNFSASGIQTTRINKPEAGELAKTIAYLGEQGWEMVGTGYGGGNTQFLYFKRPKE